MMEIIGKTNIDFLGKRRIAFAFSGVLVATGLWTLVMIGVGKANLGIELAGGTSAQLNFERPVEIEEARAILEKGGLADAELQEFTGTNKLLIRIKHGNTAEAKAADAIQAAFRSALPDNPFVVDSVTEIGPSIGKRLQKNAALAVLLSFIGFVAYIAFRFEFRFGVAAAVSTFHNVLAVMGLFTVLGKEINLLHVTALLTLAGYSLNDTVVVYDRIRENLRKRHREPLVEVINRSVNQVLSRTIVVSLTVVLVLVALTFWGGEVLHDFALAMLFGVIIGTYSSIFVASALVLVWRGRGGRIIAQETNP